VVIYHGVFARKLFGLLHENCLKKSVTLLLHIWLYFCFHNNRIFTFISINQPIMSSFGRLKCNKITTRTPNKQPEQRQKSKQNITN